jgi:hypothetical protein
MQYDGSGGTTSESNAVTNNDGYILLIEHDSRDFPKNFAYDTIAGMMNVDRISLRMKHGKNRDNNNNSSGIDSLTTSIDEEKQLVSKFVAKWKQVD